MSGALPARGTQGGWAGSACLPRLLTPSPDPSGHGLFWPEIQAKLPPLVPLYVGSESSRS